MYNKLKICKKLKVKYLYIYIIKDEKVYKRPDKIMIKFIFPGAATPPFLLSNVLLFTIYPEFFCFLFSLIFISNTFLPPCVLLSLWSWNKFKKIRNCIRKLQQSSSKCFQRKSTMRRLKTMYSGICLKRTPLVRKNMSSLDKCPLYRDFSFYILYIMHSVPEFVSALDRFHCNSLNNESKEIEQSFNTAI